MTKTKTKNNVWNTKHAKFVFIDDKGTEKYKGSDLDLVIMDNPTKRKRK